MSIRDKIRAYIDSQDRPAWSCEIMAASGCKAKHITAMVLDGSLVKHEGNPLAYSVGRRPSKYTPEQRAAARNAAEDKRSVIRNAERMAARRAAGVKQRAPRRTDQQQPAVKRVNIVLASKHATGPGESVADFLARGGSIERLPGFQRDGVHARRRPGMDHYRSMSA